MSRQIDNQALRRRYTEEEFGNKRSTTDGYTGERIFRTNEGLERKHPTTKIANADHVVPIDRVQKRFSDLSQNQQRSLANDRSNIVHTNEHLNTSKRAASNSEYVVKRIKDCDPLPVKTAANMVSAQVKSEVRMGVRATGMRVENAVDKLRKK